jgi:formylglycine-generating enzyme
MVRALLMMLISACAYDASYGDCAIRCAADSSCPDGLSCGNEGLCREPGVAATCDMILGDAGTGQMFPSCVGLVATCGPNADADCCSIATPIPGGTFYRSYDAATDDMYTSMSYPATISSFVLDKYEVTVGRFRKFVEAQQGTQQHPPAAGSGAHPHITSSGWDASWNSSLVASTAALVAAVKCDATYQTWTDVPGANENLPINCVDWYEAEAFCVWDGAFLPSEAEWNYAASGGNEQRAYPWSNPPSSLTVDCSYANYDNSTGLCVADGTNHVGSTSPKGDGKWGQTDLAGSLWEWTLDWYASTYPTTTCIDCANLDPGSSCPICPARSVKGGSFSRNAPAIRAAGRGFSVPDGRASEFGIRCARS